MMKKFVSMFLALVMCLSLAAPALAVEEEATATNEPAVQVADEDEHIHDYHVKDVSYIIPDDYTTSGHAYIERHHHKCDCGDQFYETHDPVYRAHKLYDTGHSAIFDNGNGVVTLPLYACRLCNYTTFDP